MLPVISLSTGRNTTALGFGCASLMRLPEARDRQRLLDLAVDLGIRHFDGARLYGLGQVPCCAAILAKLRLPLSAVSVRPIPHPPLPSAKAVCGGFYG